jgi:DNA-binding GntR family transcriptional regulator
MPGSKANSLRPPARHHVRDEIVRMIVGGQFQPGQQLVQEQLAKQFEVTQGVIRESLLELSFNGIVEAVDRQGVFVSALDARKVLEAYEIRAALESLAARACCQRANREQVELLRRRLAHSCKLAWSGKTRETQIADREFHHQIVEISGNESVLRLIKSLWYLQIVLDLPFEPQPFAESHEAILNAIAENRPDDAERLMRADIELAKTVFEDLMNDKPFVPQCVGLVG